LEAIVSELSTWSGAEFQAESDEFGRRFVAEVFGLSVVANDAHDLEDDAGIAFSRYPIQVSFVRYGGGEDPALLEELARLLARLLSRRLWSRLSCRSIVVEGVQKLLERCPEDAAADAQRSSVESGRFPGK
jgi:hypothetical protein